MVTDANQQVVWRGEYSPFGEATESVNAIEQNLRFPGQYFDVETGLHYNYFRDYAPSLGRYIQSDPIGLDDGSNTYAYVHNNPILEIDPTGEWGAVGAAIGGVLDFGLQLAQNGGNINCVKWGQVAASAALGAVGAGIGSKLEGVAGKGKVFSHWTPSRAKNWPGFGGKRGRDFLKKGNKYNGNYVSKQRHYKHDNKYYGHEKGDGFLRRNEWGARWPRPIQQLDRVPNIYKGGLAAGAAGNVAGGGGVSVSRKYC